MRRAAAGAALAAAVALIAAGTGADDPPMDDRGTVAEALALLSPQAQAGATGLRVRPARPGDPRAALDTQTGEITLFLRPGDAPHSVAHDIAHELGHRWDLAHGTPASRAIHLARRGAPGAPWWPARPGAEPSSGAGDFAETYARCHAASPAFRSRLAPTPADPCALLPEAAR